MALVFLAVVIGGSLLSFVRHPVWGMYAYVIVFYMDAPSRWWWSSVPNIRWSLIMVAVTAAATVLYKTQNKTKD